MLCSPDALSRHSISFETGAAHLRGIPLVPLCHSGLKPQQLPVPLSAFEGVLLCDSNRIPGSRSETGFKRFYRAIAEILRSDLPEADFEQYERKLRDLEKTYEKEHDRLAECSVEQAGVEIVQDPRALCISSHQFMAQGFENQLDIVLKAFPAALPHERVFDSESLKKLVLQQRQKAQVVHIAAYVCPRSGDLYFSDVDLSTGVSSGPVDRITADALERLLETAETRLVVITGSDSMALTATLLGAAHVIAARDMVSPQMLAAWVREFYDMLPSHPLSRALEFAMKASRAPMRLYAKQAKSVDLVLKMAAGAEPRGAVADTGLGSQR